MHAQLAKAKHAFYSADYLDAIDCYKDVITEYPHWKEGKIALAKSFFARCTQTDQGAYYQFGMWYLEGDKYSFSERQEMQAYLSAEYKQEFQDAWRSA